MAQEDDKEPGLDADLSSLSPESLVELIQLLEGSSQQGLRKRVQKELADRLKKRGFTSERIAILLTTNVYGTTKKRAIAKEWAEALDITPLEFLRFIGK